MSALVGCALLALSSTAALAQSPTIRPVTWNVVGLDSNNVNVGPNVFPVGARVCAAGSALAGHKARHVWVTTSPNITRTSPQVLNLPDIPAGACQDVFHEVTVTRTAAAYGNSAQYRIELLDASNNVVTSTPANREIFVEFLISQNRNRVQAISLDSAPLTFGSTVQLAVGRTYTIRLDGKTATQGYEQLEEFLTLPSNVFRVNSVTATYTANAGTDPDALTKLYADGCGWVNDITSPTYRECSGRGKYGGTTSRLYNVTVIGGAGTTAPAQGLIYDFSGSSYHYNTDFGKGFVNFQIINEADLSITKTDGVAGIESPGSLTYTIVVTNNGPSEVTAATVVDTAPAGVTFGSWTCAVTNPGSGGTVTTACGAASGSGNLNTTVTMKSGAVITYTVPATVAAGVTGTLTNTATVTAPAGVTDPTPGNNSASDTTTVTLSTADISINKALITPPGGADVAFRLTVVNLGTGSPSGDVVVEDTIPAGYDIPTNPASWGSSPSGYVAVADGTNARLFRWTIPAADLPFNATITLDIPLNYAAAGGALLNTATVSSPNDPNPANNSSSAGPNAADLSITKTDERTVVAPGSSTTYTLVVTNHGPLEVTGATVADTQPTDVTFTSWSCAITNAGSGGSVTTACPGSPIGGGSLSATVNMKVGAVLTFTGVASVSGSASGTISNTATVAPPGGVTDPVLGNNSATDSNSVGPFADLAVTKTVNNSVPAVGERVTFTVTVTNNGPAAVTGATIVDTLPNGYAASPVPTVSCTVVTAGTGVASACSSQAFSGATMNATANLGVGGVVRYTIEANVNGTGPDWLNSVTVAPPNGTTDPTPGNNTATASAEPSILSIVKTVAQPTYAADQTATFTIRVGKAGNSASLGTITVTDVPPPGMTLVTMSGTGWSCTVNGTGVCTRTDDLLAGDGFYPNITVTATFAQGSVSPPLTAFTNFVFTTDTSGGKYAETTRGVSIVPVAAPPQPIPTLSFWAMLLLGGLVSAFGARRFRARG